MALNLFTINWPQPGGALTAIIVIAFIIEHGLAVLIENRHIIKPFENGGWCD